MNIIRYGTLFLGLGLASPGAFGQEKPFAQPLSPDYAAADVSASAMLNPNSDPVLRPGNVRKVTLSYQTTALQAGAAPVGIEWSPCQSLWRARNLEDYARKRSLYRLTVGGAFARFPNSASRLSWALAWTPMDKADPLADETFYRKAYTLQVLGEDSLQNLERLQAAWGSLVRELAGSCLDTAGIRMQALLDSVSVLYPLSTHPYDTLPKPVEARVVEAVRSWRPQTALRQAELFYRYLGGYFPEYFAAAARVRKGVSLNWRADLQKMKDAFREKNWNRAALRLGVGGTVFASDGHVEGFVGERLTAFAAYATSFNGHRAERRWHQMVFHVQYSLPVRTADAERGDTLRQAFSLGAKLYVGEAQNRFFLQGVYTRMESQTAQGPKVLGFWQGRTGYELRVVEGLYLSAEAGYTQFGSADGALLPIALLQVKYGFGGGGFGRP